ncbi:MAG TPA: hypothetical protein VLK37_05805 [Solirubrobacterales bacterium]|nr:hypothetical protein [Solirubrobacterales bacterium]
MRLKLFTVLFVFCAALVPAGASAEPLPPYDGGMSFHEIQGPEGPEEFSWEVKLGEEEELRQVDDRHAAVYYTGEEHIAFSIEATSAHDAEGTSVPTTLAVTEPNVITLTVHHRAGNPAAGGAPFDYPVLAGAGWEGGFMTEQVVLIETNRQGPSAPQGQQAPPTCVVPDLTGRTLRGSRKILHRAHCQLGLVRGERRREARVTEQYRQVGKVLPAWAAVDVKANPPGQYSRVS